MLLLDHIPLPGVLARSVADASQTTNVPVIGVGIAFTVTFCVLKHPVGNVYVIVAVPSAAPDTNPAASTLAINALLLDHVPPDTVFVNVLVVPMHTAVLPAIVPGDAMIVTVA